jgi:predicted nucleic acid-binding protein
MFKMLRTIISDTSCLIVLTNIGELELLYRTYGKITTTAEIAEEYGQPLPDWIEIKAASDKNLQYVLELQIDKGEASAIALAIEIQECTIILDDYAARKVAEKLGIAITGTLGVIIKAKLRGIIDSIKPYLDKIKQTDFRLTPELEKLALIQAGE